MLNQIALVGGGGHASSCVELISQSESFELLGYVAPEKSALMEDIDVEFLGSDQVLQRLVADNTCLHVAVGQIKSSDKRCVLYSAIRSMGGDLPNLVAANAVVAKTASLGCGNFVGLSAMINAKAQVGDNCIINTSAILEHGALVGDHCHIAPGAIVLGDAVVESHSFIGSGAIIREGMRIARGSVVTAGALVMTDNEKRNFK